MGGSDAPAVSLILTVKNEASTLTALFASLDAQTLPPDEVILVDGGSSDGTLDIARSWRTERPFIIVSEPGANIAAGRNLALKRATGEVIAVTDAGTRLDPRWLEELTEPFRRSNALQPDVVAGFFEADPQTTFETALAVTTLPDVDEIEPLRFLPSSRSIAFRRSLIDAGFAYPEWLDYCEDVVFDLKLKRAGVRFEFRPQAKVALRPRHSARAYWTQYYRYARGDGKSGLFTLRHAVRYATYAGLLPLALRRRDRISVVIVTAGPALYLRKPLRRLFRRRQELEPIDLLAALALIPGLRLVGDVAKMAGYLAGLWWRLQRYGIRKSWRTIAGDGSTPRD